MGARYYPVEGKDLVSVTTFLSVMDKPGLIPWAASEERKFLTRLIEYCVDHDISTSTLRGKLDQVYKLKFAYFKDLMQTAQRGTRIHKAIDNYLKGKPVSPNLKDEEKVRLHEWLVWWKASGYKLIHTEKTVYDLELGYAGTMDAYCEKEGKFYVLDWKSGRGLWPEQVLQNAAYRHAAAKLGMPSEGGRLIHISSTGTYEKIVEDKRGTNMRKVELALELYKLEHPNPRIKKGSKGKKSDKT